MNKQLISIIIPAYNEEGNILKILQEIDKNINKKSYAFEVIFVNDGSSDNTLFEIKKNQKTYNYVKYVSFSRNFGHQNALIAGLHYAKGDAVISMDCDLQHPPKLISEMLNWWKKGYDVVYTVRNDNDTRFFKKVSSSFFYKIINVLSDINLDKGAADFRLLDRKVVDIINSLKESVIFLRGMISWLGFKQYAISYFPEKRFSGKTKYSIKKMLYFAIDGITSFSIKPLKVSIIIGFIFSLFSGFYAIFALIAYLFHFQVISGWSSMIVSVLFLGGIQLIILGIFGEYLGKLFLESKKRPLYIVENISL